MPGDRPVTTLAQDFAAFATGPLSRSVPPLAIERARMSLASTIASAAAGIAIPSVRIVRDLEIDAGGKAEASVWFSASRLPVRSAVRCNAMASDAAASDDSDMRSIAHIGTIVSSATIAIAEGRHLAGREMLRAMAIGYEIAGRIDEALTPGRMKRGFHGSVSTVFGAAVAAGVLLELDATRMTHAIAIAATSIGGIAISADTSWAREYHAGLSATLGVNAAHAAQRGFTGEPAVLDGPRGFIAAMGGEVSADLTLGFADSWDIVTDMAIKLMPGGHPYHAIAEAAAQAAIDGDVDPSRVERIVLSAAQLRDLHGPTHPTDLVGAAHSVVYFTAAAVVDRGFSWQHIADPAKMTQPSIVSLLDKVEIDPNSPPLPDRFPHRHGGTVTIVMQDGRRFSNTCMAPRGSGARGIDWADVDAKYRHLVPPSGMSDADMEASLDCIHAFDSAADVQALTKLLRK